MSFWDRVSGIVQQQNAHALASQDAAIAKAKDFQNRVSGIRALEQQRNGALKDWQAATGNNPDVLPPLDVLSSDPNSSGAPTVKPHNNHYGSASAVGSSSVSPSVLNYLNADLAQYYGMSKTTAYQEALSNTSYQRAVKDMKDAGLNPAVLFGSGHAQTANSSVYASEQRSGGGYSRRYGRGSSGKDQLFSGSMYSALSVVGGLVGMAATKNPMGYWIGSQTVQGTMGLLNAVYQGRR